MLVHSPINPEDFLSFRERHPNKRFLDAELECQAYGLSVFENIEHIKRVRSRIKRLRNHTIGTCILNPDMGVIKPTKSQFGNSHRTWWIPIGMEPWKYFQIIEE